jgi:regulator of protease activity HflC (stomatin/prohibitin superfamily)
MPAGRHVFWAVGRTVKVAKMDTRPTPLEVTAEEILTKDRVGIRVTLTAFTRVIDPEKAELAAGDVANTVYRLVQFALQSARRWPRARWMRSWRRVTASTARSARS